MHADRISSKGLDPHNIYVYFRLIGLVGRAFVNGPGNQGSIPGRVTPKTLKMVLDTSWLHTQ